MIDHQLLKKINSGKCFVFIGSGPSCEVGYPSWETMCKNIFEKLKLKLSNLDVNSYEKYIKDRKYPEFLKLVENDLKSRDLMLLMMQEEMKLSSVGTNAIYTYLTKWPFATYLTTNYDDEINKHLVESGFYFTLYRNTKDDLSAIRNGANKLIVKIHSDFTDPKNIIATSDDYSALIHAPERQYLREKLKSIFQMFDVLVVGHSMYDPDIQYLLESAKEAASPHHPVYFITTGLSNAEIAEFRQKYNIIAHLYDNGSKNHSGLKKLLATIDKFLIPRKELFRDENELIDESEVTAASSIFIYRKLFGAQKEDPSMLEGVIKGLVLKSLETTIAPGKDMGSIITLSPLASIPDTQEMRHTAEVNLLDLKKESMVGSDKGKYWITSEGQLKLSEIEIERKLQEDQALGQFGVDIKILSPSCLDSEVVELKNIMRDVLIDSFRERGLTITKVLNSSASIDVENLPEIFRLIIKGTSRIANEDIKNSFVDCARKFILEPNNAQKEYLLSLSQGYFLYHMVGLDPTCSKFRRDVFEKTAWLFDSSIIIPFLAKGCYNHEYASDVIQRLKKFKVPILTTEKLLTEVINHLGWANAFMKDKPIDSLEVLSAATGAESYRQNLFLDGCIRQVADGIVNSYQEYISEIFNNGIKPNQIKEYLTQNGINVISIDDIKDFELKAWGDVVEITDQIKKYRISKNTYRSDEQISAEAEMLLIIRVLRNKKISIKNINPDYDRAYFVSQSHVLDKISDDPLITWSPESVYRYITSIPGEMPDKDLLQQCMLQEFYYAGINFIDIPRYKKTFGTIVNEAKMNFDREKNRYIEQFEKENNIEFEKSFENTPDLQKPFFVSQMTWKLAIEAEKRAMEREKDYKRFTAEKEVEFKEKEEKRKIKEKEREKQIEATLRNYQDPKHRKKRIRQAKKRKKNK